MALFEPLRFRLLILLFLFTPLVYAQGLPVAVPSPPDLQARSFYLEDFNSGSVLAEHNADERMEPASITKLMTAYVVEKALESGDISLDDKVTISEKAWKMKGSRMFIEVGTEVSVLELLKGLIIQSGNDASVALAEHVAGTEEAFVGYMNHYAEQLGLSNTHFANSTGWPDPDHYMSARDIAKLSRALIAEFPQHYALYKEKEFTYNNIPQWNRNKLLWRDETVDGVKTGHTESAGFCLVSSAIRGEMRLIAVVLGTDSEEQRADQSQALLNYGFRFFETHKLYDAGEVLKEARVWKGETEKLPLGLDQTLFVTIPQGQYQALSAKMELNGNIVAPTAKGQQFGKVEIELAGEPIAERPLVALASVGDGGLIQRAIDGVLMWFQ
jgi:D-alanyl-D-alanine carboxypeptidase (penicillin-binding protein 5/6)